METTLVKIDDFKALISTAPAALEENKASYATALKKGEELIALASGKMDDIIDDQLSTYISRVKATIKTMKEKREPFTQIMTMVAKEFTTLESALKDPVERCQKLRDAYATKKMEERREQERLAALRLAKEQELIEAEKDYRIKYAAAAANHTLSLKQKELAWFNSLTLDKVESAEQSINLIGGSEMESCFYFTVTPFAYRYATQAEFEEQFPAAERQKLVTEAFLTFKKETALFKRELMDMLPSKIKQLEEAEAARIAAEAEAKRRAAEAEAARIAAEKANAEEKVRLEAEAKRKAAEAEAARIDREAAEAKRRAEEEARKAEEAARIAAEAEAAKRKAEAEAALKAAERKATSFVDAQADLFVQAPKVKEGYQIIAKDNSAWLLLVQLWFEKEGHTLPADKFENMTLGRIKTFCEKYASKKEEFIESKLIEYKPVYKAK
ncbi:MAG: hypothetical protein LBF89_00615 [Bacteroidales bacterium]|jgi:hypothetical protein|nr:hypothetical protein [Bacteroidales bacterium]